MIDAYEIGIQLLLQDDVSAGLAVINRGLAEVDRAIAATSANLAGLVGEADRAAKAVAVAVGAKEPPSVAGEPKAVIAAGETPSRPAKEGSPGAAATAPADAGGQRGGEPPASPSKAISMEERQPAQASATPSNVDRISTVTAPGKSVSNDAGSSDRREARSVPGVGEAAPAKRMDDATTAPDAPLRRNDRAVSAGDAARRPGSAAPNTTLAVTATVGPSRAVSSPAPTRSQAGVRVAGQSPAEPDRAATAPWSIGHPVTPQSSSARPTERAAAPQSPGRERAEGGGGAVMLDGRLVGQWLSEHMAREASRPPSGTSFFDARQTPAWNVSGAL